MPQWLNIWNKRLTRWLWWFVLAGVLAALPVMSARIQTETSADEVAFVLDYRDLLQVSATQAEPRAFVAEKLALLKDAGVNGMVVFESTLEELTWAGEVVVYNASQAALLENRVVAQGDNGTYVLFNDPSHEQTLRPIIEWAFTHHGAKLSEWTAGGRSGLRIGMGYDDAMLRPMQPNPLAMKALKDAGFQIVPRLSDRFTPYDPQEMKKWLTVFKSVDVHTVVFDGDAVTGFGKGLKYKGVNTFAMQLNQEKIGIAMFENLRVPQKGISKLANLLNYNAIRAHSIGEAEMAIISKKQLEDRIVLAVKDRNIRLVYLNTSASRDALKGQVSYSVDNIADILRGEVEDSANGEELKGEAAGGAIGESAGGAIGEKSSGGAIADLKKFGFEPGVPHAFEVNHAPQELLLRGIAALGAISLCALMIGLFLPSLLLPLVVAGGLGGAALYVWNSTLMVQALALFVSIAAPTAAVVLLIKRLRMMRVSAGDRPMSAWRRVGLALLLLLRTTVLSVTAIPFIVALLNHITYSMVLQQFRGVSLLHLAPIALVGVYVFLYGSGNTVIENLKKILAMPLTVLWVAGIGILGFAGMYYLTRTGNEGQVSGLEMAFRSLLENTFGVRPRTKEFLLGHPMFLFGIFLALRYRWGLVLLIPATIAQLSMVDTFAHIHTPFLLSVIRVCLGLGIGVLIGLAVIAAWQILEGVRARWLRQLG